MLLTGSYRRSLDDKLRLSIPKQLRDVLADSNLFIAPGTDRALVIYTAEVLEQIGEALSKVSPAAREARSFSRLFYAQSQPADMDRQGRLRIPPELARFAGVVSEVMIVGVRDRIEIWDSAAWDKFLEATQPTYDELAEQVFGDVQKAN